MKISVVNIPQLIFKQGNYYITLRYVILLSFRSSSLFSKKNANNIAFFKIKREHVWNHSYFGLCPSSIYLK